MRISPHLLALALGAGVPALATAVEFPGAEPDATAPSPAEANDPFAEYADSMYMREFEGLRWGAYGELHYNNPMGNGEPAELDLHRLVFMAEYTFNDHIDFFTEIEIEHAFVKDGNGELEVEQAYVDFDLHEKASVKAGVLLVPISIMNLYHEPPLFHGVERPVTQYRVVPTTWFEPGVAVHGEIAENLNYEVAIQAGLDGSGISSKGLRGGRQKAFESKAEDLMVTARLDWRPMPELWLASAVNTGNTSQDPDADFDGNVTLYTLEGRYEWQDLTVGLSWSQAFIGDAEELSAANGSTVSESIHGLEVFAAYDIGRYIGDGDQTLEPFARFEIIDTQADVPDGLPEDESQTGTVLTVGVTYKPIPRIAIKGDYQDVDNDAEDAVDMFNLGIGWMF